MHKFKEIAAKDDRLIHRLGKKIATEVTIKCRNKNLRSYNRLNITEELIKFQHLAIIFII